MDIIIKSTVIVNKESSSASAGLFRPQIKEKDMF